MEQSFLDPVAELRLLNRALGPHAEDDGAVGQVVARQLREVREEIAALCREAGLRDPEGFAWAWEIAVKGALISALEGDAAALEHAQSITQLLLAEQPIALLEDGT